MNTVKVGDQVILADGVQQLHYAYYKDGQYVQGAAVDSTLVQALRRSCTVMTVPTSCGGNVIQVAVCGCIPYPTFFMKDFVQS